MARLIVTIKDPKVLEKINALPKLVRGKVVEQALAQYLKSSEGAHIFELFSKKRKSLEETGRKTATTATAKHILGGFSGEL